MTRPRTTEFSMPPKVPAKPARWRAAAFQPVRMSTVAGHTVAPRNPLAHTGLAHPDVGWSSGAGPGWPRSRRPRPGSLPRPCRRCPHRVRTRVDRSVPPGRHHPARPGPVTLGPAQKHPCAASSEGWVIRVPHGRSSCWFRGRAGPRDRLAEVRRHDRRCERFDAVDDGLEADRAEEVECVLRAGQLGVDDRVGGGAAGLLGERACPAGGGKRVLVAVDDKKRRRASLGVVKWRGGQRLTAGRPAVVAIKPDNRRDGRVGLMEPRLECGVVHREARQRGQAGAE